MQRVSDAQRIGKIGDWEWNIDTGAITWSAAVFNILGRDERRAVWLKDYQSPLGSQATTLSVRSSKIACRPACLEPSHYEILRKIYYKQGFLDIEPILRSINIPSLRFSGAEFSYYELKKFCLTYRPKLFDGSE